MVQSRSRSRSRSQGLDLDRDVDVDVDEVQRDAVGAVQCSSNQKRFLCPGDWPCLTADCWWLVTGDW